MTKRRMRPNRVAARLSVSLFAAAIASGCAESDAHDDAARPTETPTTPTSPPVVTGPAAPSAAPAAPAYIEDEPFVSAGPLEVAMPLDYVWSCVDAETFAALVASDSPLRSLGRFDFDRSKGDEDDPRTFYVTFDRTYLEVHAPRGKPGRATGSAGVVLHVDRLADFADLRTWLEDYTGEVPAASTHTSPAGEEEIPIFYETGVRLDPPGDEAQPTFLSGFLTYHLSAYLAMQIPPPADQRLLREVYLHGAQGSPRRSAVSDIVAIDLALAEEERSAFAFELQVAGYHRSDEAGVERWEGPGIVIRIADAATPGAPRLRRVVMALRTPPAEATTHAIGSTTLRIGTDGRAEWILAAPTG